jgi:hypothetical protein
MKALWGMEGSLESMVESIAKAGYAGVEAPMPSIEEENKFKELLEQYNLSYIAMVFTGGDHHYGSFEEQVTRAVLFKPELIVSHSSRDSHSYDEQLAFFEQALALEKQVGYAVGHETHRGRAMFTPWGTAKLLKDLPELNITADFSHWVVVAESLLEDQADAMELAIQRTIHIHSRVGYAQGPQVAHPGAPEYERELAVHEGWWDRIVANRAAQGASVMTITPEFGPPGYLHTLPFTNAPVADLWEVCLWMKQRLQSKYI